MMRDFTKRPKWEEVNGHVYEVSDDTFNKPLKWQRTGKRGLGGRRLLVFASSLTDFFHEQLDGRRKEAWDIVAECDDLMFQVLTKRIDRVNGERLPENWGKGWENVSMGVSVENQEKLWERLPQLVKVPARSRFLSVEPMVGEVDLMEMCEYMEGVDWVIVGGESGNDSGKWGYRECKMEWVRKVVEDCREMGIPVFVKQLGTHLGKKLGGDRHGREMGCWPSEIQFRQFPKCYE